MKAKAVDFISYAVSDMDRSEAFYREILGLDVEVARGAPGTRAFGYMELDAGGVALAVADVGEAVDELRGKGVTIAMDPIETPVCFMAVVEDPDGNKVLLHQRKDGTAG